MSHHVHVLVTCSNIHKRLLHCEIREKRERKREGSEGEIRKRERERSRSERERGKGVGMQILAMHACMHAQQKQVGNVDL